jgi:hypothetical protein
VLTVDVSRATVEWIDASSERALSAPRAFVCDIEAGEIIAGRLYERRRGTRDLRPEMGHYHRTRREVKT